MARRGIRFAWLVFVMLLIGAGVLLRWSSGYDPGSSFLSDVDRGYYTPSDQSSQPTEQVPEIVSVHGTVVDDADTPIHGVEVELIPVSKVGDERWYATKREWTTTDGQYHFSGVESGEYFVGVQMRAAPDERHPFAGAYYPGADDESGADLILVTQSSPVELQPMHLRRLETVTIQVRLAFEDGSVPRWGNLLFHNASYPYQGVIGDEAPGIEDGRGEIVLPQGFEYHARAKVDCDAGTRIQSRESRPILQFKVADGLTPEELTFTVPGPSCKLWSPK